MPTLFDPLELGSIELANRIAMAPLTRARAGREATPNALMAAYYAQRASAGLIISEATGISREGLGWPNAPGLWNAKQVEGWKLVTDAVHHAGGRIVAQLWHMGRLVHPDLGRSSAGQLVRNDGARLRAHLRRQEAVRGSARDDAATTSAGSSATMRRPRAMRSPPGSTASRSTAPMAISSINSFATAPISGPTNMAARSTTACASRPRFSRRSATRSAWTASASASRRTSIRKGVEDSDPAAVFTALAQRLEELKVPWIELREAHQPTFGGRDPDRAGQSGDALDLFRQDPAQQRL